MRGCGEDDSVAGLEEGCEGVGVGVAVDDPMLGVEIEVVVRMVRTGSWWRVLRN